MNTVSFKKFVAVELPFMHLSNDELTEVLEASENMIKHHNDLEKSDPMLFDITRSVKNSLTSMNIDLWQEVARRN